MRTTLSPEQLADLAVQGQAEAAKSRFVDPCAVVASKKILRERGEEWAASVLMRDLSRRSLLFGHLPWLEDGEMETLILADRAEWEQIVNSLQSA
ncbi:hypothetical protein ACIBHX_01770 [Nonomuraea sp. NPDC050536]|uniref:hypothetical protein n=1 Tax=Nonomuraea sp. NPDC050536 TaxID=3364366 RepID=UPI0037C69029